MNVFSFISFLMLSTFSISSLTMSENNNDINTSTFYSSSSNSKSSSGKKRRKRNQSLATQMQVYTSILKKLEKNDMSVLYKLFKINNNLYFFMKKNLEDEIVCAEIGETLNRGGVKAVHSVKTYPYPYLVPHASFDNAEYVYITTRNRKKYEVLSKEIEPLEIIEEFCRDHDFNFCFEQIGKRGILMTRLKDADQVNWDLPQFRRSIYSLFSQLLLAADHKPKISNQDLKPENILFTKDNLLALLMDWGEGNKNESGNTTVYVNSITPQYVSIMRRLAILNSFKGEAEKPPAISCDESLIEDFYGIVQALTILYLDLKHQSHGDLQELALQKNLNNEQFLQLLKAYLETLKAQDIVNDEKLFKLTSLTLMLPYFGSFKYLKNGQKSEEDDPQDILEELNNIAKKYGFNKDEKISNLMSLARTHYEQREDLAQHSHTDSYEKLIIGQFLPIVEEWTKIYKDSDSYIDDLETIQLTASLPDDLPDWISYTEDSSDQI